MLAEIPEPVHQTYETFAYMVQVYSEKKIQSREPTVLWIKKNHLDKKYIKCIINTTLKTDLLNIQNTFRHSLHSFEKKQEQMFADR